MLAVLTRLEQRLDRLEQRPDSSSSSSSPSSSFSPSPSSSSATPSTSLFPAPAFPAFGPGDTLDRRLARMEDRFDHLVRGQEQLQLVNQRLDRYEIVARIDRIERVLRRTALRQGEGGEDDEGDGAGARARSVSHGSQSIVGGLLARIFDGEQGRAPSVLLTALVVQVVSHLLSLVGPSR